MMKIDRIVADLREERDRLDNAITALESLGGRGRRGAAAAGRRRRRKMSAAARKRISMGMKARWAQRRKQQPAKQ